MLGFLRSIRTGDNRIVTTDRQTPIETVSQINLERAERLDFR
jgi:hypothetical protein